MVLKKALALATGAMLLASFQAYSAGPAGNVPATALPGATQIQGSPAFQCPTAGTRITNNIGGGLTWQGTDPADPTVCLRTNVNGQQQRALYNFQMLPLADETSVRRGMAPLWPLATGKSTSFVFIGTSARGDTWQYQETWRVERAERIMIAGAPRNTFVIQRTQEGRLGNTFRGSDTFWYDTASRTFVKAEIRVFSGTTSARSWEATQIVVR